MRVGLGFLTVAAFLPCVLCHLTDKLIDGFRLGYITFPLLGRHLPISTQLKPTVVGGREEQKNECQFIIITEKYRSILKSRDITLPTKVHLVKAMIFPVVMYGCESWTEHQRIDAFELWCWRRPLRVPWTARRYNQSILKKSVLNIHWKD